ncbi:MAG: ATP-dependent DNA helicase RecG [Mariprofundaceae bacterium]|nr:ATP-dependent DNA helicase RecG [Mariprofundaceae bacterium]
MTLVHAVKFRQAYRMYQALRQEMSMIHGVGPALAKRLSGAGIYCMGDLLLRLPKTYIDDRETLPIRNLQEGVVARTSGRVLKVEATGMGKRRQVIIGLGDDSGAQIQLRFFHSPYLLRDARLTPGREISVRGKPEWWRKSCQMAHPEWMPLEAFSGGWRPVYASVAGLTGARIAGMIGRSLSLLPHNTASPFDAILKAYPSLRQAIDLIHSPPDDGPESESAKKAFERLRLEELLTYLHLMRQMRRQAQAQTPAWTGTALAEAFLASLPYSLTEAQASVWKEIQQDLSSGLRMHRLLQGDVGAGKTWVAALSMLMAIDHGCQTALMAPTSILAGQHAETLNELFTPLGRKAELLTGGLRAKERKRVVAGLANGSIDMVVGTHALISEDVRYHQLGLAVVDEQHRFGVRQRWILTERGDAVHLLAMTATPIPRSLALALYGDMDLSLMHGMPPGRKPVETRVVSGRGKLADGMHRMLDEGGRTYWIVPRIDEDEDGVSVDQRVEALKQRFPDAGVQGLHGRMKPKEKDAILAAFAKGDCRLLVSTTVVEVGVNVPEARLMVIEQAENYGLAQLHQLRGRVGRSHVQSYCILLPSRDASEAQISRLGHVAAHHDGLELAELDLQLRGAGDAIGTSQSGEAGFRLLDVVRDAALIHYWHGHLPSVKPTDAMFRFWRPVADSVD